MLHLQLDTNTNFLTLCEKLIASATSRWFSNIGRIRKLLALPCKLWGMDIIDPTENANDEYKNWREPTSQLKNPIKEREHLYTASDKNIKKWKYSIKKKRKDKHLNILTSNILTFNILTFCES